MLPASVFRAASNLRPAILSLSQRHYSTRRTNRERQIPRVFGKWRTPPDPKGVAADLENENETLGWFVAKPSPRDDPTPYKRAILPKFPAPPKVRRPRMPKPPPSTSRRRPVRSKDETIRPPGPRRPIPPPDIKYFEAPPDPAPRRPPVQYKNEMIRPPGPRRPIPPPDPDIKYFKAPLEGKAIRRATIRARKLARDTALAEKWLDFNGHWQAFRDKIVEWEKFTGTKCQIGIPCPVRSPKRVPYRDRWNTEEEKLRKYKLIY